MSNRPYDFSLSAVLGSSQRIDAMGSMVKVLTAPGGAVGVKLDGGQEIQLKEGQGIRLPSGVQFRDVLVRNLQAVAQQGSIFIGDSSFEDSTVTGTVRVVDGERDKVASGLCFRGTAAQAGGTNGPFVQVYNPAGSGKNLFVQAVRMGALNADSYGIGTSASALPTGGGAVSNLKRSGPAAVALIKLDNTGAAQTAPQQIAAGYISASNDIVVLFPRPVLVAPGESIYCYVLGLANNLRANFEWEEWPI